MASERIVTWAKPLTFITFVVDIGSKMASVFSVGYEVHCALSEAVHRIRVRRPSCPVFWQMWFPSVQDITIALDSDSTDQIEHNEDKELNLHFLSKLQNMHVYCRIPKHTILTYTVTSQYNWMFPGGYILIYFIPILVNLCQL